MSDARDAILGAVSHALGGDKSAREQAVRARRENPPAPRIPARGRVGGGSELHSFKVWAERADATVDQINTRDEIPVALARYLAGRNLAAEVRAAGALSDLTWGDAPNLSVSFGAPRESDAVGLVQAFAGVAETGTLVMLSGADSPSTLNFLPETLVAVIETENLAGDYEEAWEKIRAATGGALPRTVNWITGPSRTADIEQQIMLGVHGPRRLHILVVGHEH